MVRSAKSLVNEYQRIWARADAEGRDLTVSERYEVEDLLAQAESQHRIEKQIKALDPGAVTPLAMTDPHFQPDGRPGDMFVQSKGYQRIASGPRGSQWSTGPVEVPYRTKATLLEGSMDSPGAGAPLAQFDVRPGVVPTLFQPLSVADAIPSVPVMTNKVRVIVESVATNAARPVPEGVNKPESALAFDEVDEPIVKLATVLPVSDEMLSDAPGIRGYINSRLTLFVQQEEEEQLLHGEGNNDNLLGLLPRIPAENRYVTSAADSPTNLDHIHEAITVARRSFLEPDTIVINPEDWAEVRLLKDTTENYIGGSPFSNAPQPGESLWGKRVVVTTAMPAGAAAVGAFGSAAQILRRGGLTVEASNSHADYFVQNLTAIRAEVRLGLHVARPAAFALADIGYSS